MDLGTFSSTPGCSRRWGTRRRRISVSVCVEPMTWRQDNTVSVSLFPSTGSRRWNQMSPEGGQGATFVASVLLVGPDSRPVLESLARSRTICCNLSTLLEWATIDHLPYFYFPHLTYPFLLPYQCTFFVFEISISSLAPARS